MKLSGWFFVLAGFAAGLGPSSARADDMYDCMTIDDNDPNVRIPACTRALKDNSLDDSTRSTIYGARGLAYFATGDKKRALMDYNEAVRSDPSRSASYNIRGALFASEGNYDMAIANYDHAIALEPTRANYYNNRGMAYSAKGDSDRARANYAKAIELEAK